MARPKSKLTRQEILNRRAQAAWEYRQRNKAAVNEKARVRMRAHREKLRRSSAAVQLEYAVKAAQYRQDYVERATRAARRSVAKSLQRSPPSPTNERARLSASSRFGFTPYASTYDPSPEDCTTAEEDWDADEEDEGEEDIGRGASIESDDWPAEETQLPRRCPV
ncbi:hypothetical protein R3P38DRAFT_3186201 [Favolaschia claudopus]|uniref:Uncharacterized protein n=1 Tax=Favolaschia claudopus TaxID=2862362 RepID=A0AAW0C5V3_9AGAR